jgi:dCTP deaminase
MVLSGKAILGAVSRGDISIEPFDEANLNAGSYTLTLADKLYALKYAPFLDARLDSQEYDELFIGDGHLLEPGEFVIGFTREKVTLSKYVCGFLSTRSSHAQIGLDVLESSFFIEPGSSNPMALEIKNNGNAPIQLFPGIKIAKCVFLTIQDALGY